MLLQVKNLYRGRYKAKYSYIDVEDAKLIFKDGRIFLYYASEGCNSSMVLEKDAIINYDKMLPKIKEDFSYLKTYIKMNRDCISNYDSEYLMNSYVGNDNSKLLALTEIKAMDEKIKKNLTDEQKLYIELDGGIKGF